MLKRGGRCYYVITLTPRNTVTEGFDEMPSLLQYCKSAFIQPITGSTFINTQGEMHLDLQDSLKFAA